MRKCYPVKISHIGAQMDICHFWDFCPQKLSNNNLCSNLAKTLPGQCEFTKKNFSLIGPFLGKKHVATRTPLKLEFFSLLFFFHLC